MPRPPTVRQIYALAAELCERAGEQFPESFEEASETIERLRIENGHPDPRPGARIDAAARPALSAAAAYRERRRTIGVR